MASCKGSLSSRVLWDSHPHCGVANCAASHSSNDAIIPAAAALQGVEATLFAMLMSILNGGAMTGSALGALLTKAFGITATDLHNLAALVFLCNLSSLLPLPLLRLLPEGSTREQMHDAEEQE